MQEIDIRLVTLPDGVDVPKRFWLLMIDFGGNTRQIRLFFDEQEVKQIVLELGNPAEATVLGPYTLSTKTSLKRQ